MNSIKIINYEPFIEIIIENERSKNIRTRCLLDTWFSWTLCIPYFIWKWENLSLVNNVDLHDNKTRLLDDHEWMETATWICKTYISVISVNLSWIQLDSDIFIYEHSLEYSKTRDFPIIWIRFLEENEKILNLNFKKKIFELN